MRRLACNKFDYSDANPNLVGETIVYLLEQVDVLGNIVKYNTGQTATFTTFLEGQQQETSVTTVATNRGDGTYLIVVHKTLAGKYMVQVALGAAPVGGMVDGFQLTYRYGPETSPTATTWEVSARGLLCERGAALILWIILFELFYPVKRSYFL